MSNSCQIIYVIGTGRSGTTIMKNSLALHPDIHSIGHEVQLWTDPRIKRGIWTLLSETRKNADVLCKDLTQYLMNKYEITHTRNDVTTTYQLDWISKKDYRMIVDRLMENYTSDPENAPFHVRCFFEDLYRPLLMKVGKSIIIDDAPVNGLIIPQILKAHPEAKFVHMMREGLGVASSMLKLGWESSFELAVQRWATTLMVTRQLGSRYGGSNYKEILLSDLTAHPNEKMKEICEFVGVPFYEKTTSKLNAEKGGTKKYGEFSEYLVDYVDSLYKIDMKR